jgi:pyruvate/2-oxoglutarate/acetoin dehydrogenase E1 component
VGVHRDPSYVESDYDALGWTIDDPRLDAENAWALTAGGNYDGGAVVDIGSIQVVRDGTIVTISATGAMLNEVPQLADLTQSWAVGAGLRILDLMR